MRGWRKKDPSSACQCRDLISLVRALGFSVANLLLSSQLAAMILCLSRVFAQKPRELLGDNFIFAGLQHERIHD